MSKQLLFEPFAKQEEFIAAAASGDYDFVLYGGAIRGGKTIGLLGYFVILAYHYPGSRWALVRKDLGVIKRNTLPSWNKIKPTNFIAQENSSTNEVTFVNGSKIIFFPENYNQDKELNRWKGLEVNGIGFEEINECQEKSFYKAFERSGTYIIPNLPEQPRPIVLGTCNPSRGWVKNLVYTPWKEGKLPKRWCYIQSRIYDNTPLLEAQPNLLANYKANMPPFEYDLFVEGDWDARQKSDRAFCTHFDPARHIGPAPFQENRAIYVSLDFNLEPFGFIFQHKWRDNTGFHIHQFDEAKIENGDIEQGIDWINEKYGKYRHNLIITGDKMGAKRDFGRRDKASYYERIKAGLRLSPRQIEIHPNPTHENSRSDTNYVLYHFDDFRIDPTCVESIYDMESVEVDAFGKILKRDRMNLAQRADFLDCHRYSINDKFVQSWMKWHQKQINV